MAASSWGSLNTGSILTYDKLLAAYEMLKNYVPEPPLIMYWKGAVVDESYNPHPEIDGYFE